MVDISAFWAGLVGLAGIVPWTRSSWRGLRRRLYLMVCRALTPRNDDDPAEQGSGEQPDRGRGDEHGERRRGPSLRSAEQLADDGTDPASVGNGKEFSSHDSTAAR